MIEGIWRGREGKEGEDGEEGEKDLWCAVSCGAQENAAQGGYDHQDLHYYHTHHPLPSFSTHNYHLSCRNMTACAHASRTTHCAGAHARITHYTSISYIIYHTSRSITQHNAASRSITQHHAASRSITQHHAASGSTTQRHATTPHCFTIPPSLYTFNSSFRVTHSMADPKSPTSPTSPPLLSLPHLSRPPPPRPLHLLQPPALQWYESFLYHYCLYPSLTSLISFLTLSNLFRWI